MAFHRDGYRCKVAKVAAGALGRCLKHYYVAIRKEISDFESLSELEAIAAKLKASALLSEYRKPSRHWSSWSYCDRSEQLLHGPNPA